MKQVFCVFCLGNSIGTSFQAIYPFPLLALEWNLYTKKKKKKRQGARQKGNVVITQLASTDSEITVLDKPNGSSWMQNSKYWYMKDYYIYEGLFTHKAHLRNY